MGGKAMKKRFLAFICLLLISAMLLCSCDFALEEETKPNFATEKASSEETETEKKTENTKKPEEPKPKKISTVNGKKAGDIVEQFFYDYMNATSFDITLDTSSIVQGELQKDHIDIRVDGSDIYMLRDSEGSQMQVWGIDGMVYADVEGQKVKARGSIEEHLGIDTSELFKTTLPDALSDEYLSKLNAAQIYLLAGSFYFTVDFDEEEASNFGEEFVAYSGTFYFDANGVIKAIAISYNDGSSANMRLNSYGKPVFIAPPRNAHEFVEAEVDGGGNDGGNNDFEGSENIDPEAYQNYLQVCETLKSIESYKMFYSINSEMCVIYETDGRDECIEACSLDLNYRELWLVNGVAYGREESEMPYRIGTPTQDVLDAFDTVQHIMDFSYPSVSPTEMSYAIMFDDGDLVTVIFERIIGDNSVDEYTYAFSKDMSAIYVKIDYYTLDKLIWTDEYTYSDINSPSRDIIAPILDGTPM